MKKVFGFKDQKIKHFIISLIAIVVLTGCPNFFSNTGPMQIDYSGLTLSLEWQDDSSEMSEPSAVAYYDVFYRELGTLKWNSLSSTDGPSRTITIDNNETGYGKFEFAVQAVYNNKKKSDLHKSIDFSAWPSGGWFINWHQEE